VEIAQSSFIEGAAKQQKTEV
jgi:hypothetical protein